MKTPAALALLLFLTACAAPGPYATPAPGEAAFLAGGTMTAVATYDYATRVEYTRQAVAFSDATAQAVYATQAAAGATQAAATATAQTREAATAAAATVTAQAVQATQAAVAMQTRDAGWEATRRTALETQATATALTGAAEQDRQERTRGALWGWLALLAAAGFLFALFRLLYSLAAGRLAESRIIRNARTGEPVAYRHRDGALEYLMEPEPIPALPAPEEDYEPPSIVRVNGARRETLYQYDDDLALHWRDMHIVLTQEQIRQLRRWHNAGHTRIRRDSSSAGPGVDAIGLGSGSTYNTLRAVLLGLEYIDESGAWTPRGCLELLNVQPVPPSSSPSSRLQTATDGAGEAGWGE
mgnify:CR=1 FL=1